MSQRNRRRHPKHALLAWPNRIGAADWNNRVKERALFTTLSFFRQLAAGVPVRRGSW